LIRNDMAVADNIHAVRERIERACLRTGRRPEEVKLVAVTKTVDAAKIEEAVAAGVTIVGENRVQEAWEKYQAVGTPVAWHMIGHLQRNKVKRVLRFASLIHSVDSARLAAEIHQEAQKLEKTVDVLVQVNTSGEASKFGLAPDEVGATLQEFARFDNVRVRGLMTIGAYSTDPEVVRSCFVRLREMRDELAGMRIPRISLDELSMGMTNDFEIAIEEGSTMVRIGRSIFGERNI